MENDKRKNAEKDLLEVLNGRLVLKQMLDQLEADHKATANSPFAEPEVLQKVVVELAKLHNSIQAALASETKKFLTMLKDMPSEEQEESKDNT